MREPPLRVEPETKDRTFVLERGCAECGFDPGAVSPTEIGLRLRATIPRWTTVLTRTSAAASGRSRPCGHRASTAARVRELGPGRDGGCRRLSGAGSGVAGWTVRSAGHRDRGALRRAVPSLRRPSLRRERDTWWTYEIAAVGALGLLATALALIARTLDWLWQPAVIAAAFAHQVRTSRSGPPTRPRSCARSAVSTSTC